MLLIRAQCRLERVCEFGILAEFGVHIGEGWVMVALGFEEPYSRMETIYIPGD